MGIAISLRKDGWMEDEFIMGAMYSFFHDIAEVAEKAGLDMTEYLKIADYPSRVNDNDEAIIELWEINRLLEICRKIKDYIQDVEKKGIIIYSETELWDHERTRKAGKEPHMIPNTISSLLRLIEICEMAIEKNASIVISM